MRAQLRANPNMLRHHNRRTARHYKRRTENAERRRTMKAVKEFAKLKALPTNVKRRIAMMLLGRS